MKWNISLANVLIVSFLWAFPAHDSIAKSQAKADPAIGQLQRLLQQESFRKNLKSIQAASLQILKQGAKAHPHLVKMFAHQRGIVKVYAACMLVEIYQTAPNPQRLKQIRSLFDRSLDKSSMEGKLAASIGITALANIGALSPSSYSVYKVKIQSIQSNQIKRELLLSMSLFGKELKMFVPFLKGLASSRTLDVGVRVFALFALGQAENRSNEVAVATLIGSLKDPSDWIKVTAAEALGRMMGRTTEATALAPLQALWKQKSGEKPKVVIAAASAYISIATQKSQVHRACSRLAGLFSSLTQEKWKEQIELIQTLGKCGIHGVLSLIQVLKTSPSAKWPKRSFMQKIHAVQKIHAAQMLGEIGRPAGQALPELFKKLDASDVLLREAVISALSAIRTRPDEIVRQLFLRYREENVASIQGAIVEALVQFGSRIVRVAEIGLKATKPKFRELSLRILAFFASSKSSDTDKAQSILLRASHLNGKAKVKATAIIHRLGWKTKDALLIALRDADETFRDHAASTMVRMLNATPARLFSNRLKCVARQLRSRRWRAQWGALRVFAKLAPKGKQALPTVVRQLDSSEQAVRAQAQKTLYRFGNVALPDLRRKLNDKKASTRSVVAVIQIIGWLHKVITDPKDIRLLEKSLRNEEDNIRKASLDSLARIGKKASIVVPSLLAFLTRKTPAILRHAAKNAIVSIGFKDENMIKIGLQNPSIPHSELYSICKKIAQKSGDDSIYITDLLRKLSKDKNKSVAKVAGAFFDRLIKMKPKK